MMLTVLTQNAQLGQVAKRACASLLPCGRRRFSKKKSDHVAEFHLLKRLLRHEISEALAAELCSWWVNDAQAATRHSTMAFFDDLLRWILAST
jgi:hypothetical protein